jgi:glycine betaine catabolism B
MKSIDDLLNKLTMYRLLAGGLAILIILAFLSAFLGTIDISPAHMAFSLAITTIVAYITSQSLAHYFNRPANHESWFITAAIIFFIAQPVDSWQRACLMASAAILAIATKYIVTWRGQHIFNPAAFGLFIAGFIGSLPVTWWVGNKSLLLANLLFALLVLRKMRKFQLFTTFAITTLVATSIVALQAGLDVTKSLQVMLTASPLVFLGGVMLTEPTTMPSRHRYQIIFGALVGGLAGFHPSIGPVFIGPATALLIGNLFAVIVSQKQRTTLTLIRKEQISQTVFNYYFKPAKKLSFIPGQYAEWTIPGINKMLEGNRRTFTIASSPTEQSVVLGIKQIEPVSPYKRQLEQMEVGSRIEISNIMGDFVLANNSGKYLFLAGGIGITPFRSIIKSLVDNQQKTDITLIYCVSNINDANYLDIFRSGMPLGLSVVMISPQSNVTKLDKETLARLVPDHQERHAYISGPSGFVDTHKDTVKKLGVKKITTDHFSGY